jgi:hypothetical protein
MQPIDMSSSDVEHAAYPGYLADDLHHPNRRRDLDDHDLAIDQANLDRYGGALPHMYAIRVVMARTGGRLGGRRLRRSRQRSSGMAKGPELGATTS